MKKTVKRAILSALPVTAIVAAGLGLLGCSPKGETKEFDAVTSLVNGGFESSTLSGWTVERGDAFDDDSVSSVGEFSFSYDPDHKRIPVGHTGNWYLSGKAYDGKRPHGYTGSIRSENFVLGGDGTVSMKLAGGALVYGKGENAAKKPAEKTCYVGVYTASDDRMVAKFTNKYFLEHTESYVDVNKYLSGTCCTDNFSTYSEDLSEYYGEEMYIRIVDNDTDVYYGYISVDDIRIGGGSSQADGALYVKTRDYTTDVTPPNKYEIANGGFESGSLGGWTVVSGSAFSNDGVNNAKCWWNESITYDRDGNYHYGYYEPTATGVMRSSEFVLGGSGYISYKLGGCSNNQLTYLRFMVKDKKDGDKCVGRYSNFKFWNYQFPYVENGMRCLNLVQYYGDFSEYLGKTMYIEVVDENASGDELGCITLDSVKTYHETKPTFYGGVAFEVQPDPDLFDFAPDSPHQVKNGTFETGDLEGWTLVGDIGKVSQIPVWWDKYPYNKKGEYFFTGMANEAAAGTLTSSAFTLGGTGDITFRLGGGGNPAKCYVSIIDADTEEELVRFANLGFRDNGTDGINVNSYLANMVKYHANLIDLGVEAGRSIKIRVVDNADEAKDWGFVVCDSFITYYEETPELKKDVVEAVDSRPTLLPDDGYNLVNGGFELGDITGWTVVGGAAIDGVKTGDVFWNEGIPYNNGGLFHFDGWKATPDETSTYAIRSETFTLGGSGFISFKMGGRAAVVKVYKAGETPELIAEYGNTAFDDSNFPYIDKGCRLATMTTFFADLEEYKGETLFVELCDEGAEAERWNFAFFDDIVTYHETAPSAEAFDTVKLNNKTSATGVATYNIPWVSAVNKLDAGN